MFRTFQTILLGSFMSLSPANITNMPSESSFKKQAGLAWEALRNFNAICMLNAPNLANPALHELVEATVRFRYLSYCFLY